MTGYGDEPSIDAGPDFDPNSTPASASPIATQEPVEEIARRIRSAEDDITYVWRDDNRVDVVRDDGTSVVVLQAGLRNRHMGDDDILNDALDFQREKVIAAALDAERSASEKRNEELVRDIRALELPAPAVSTTGEGWSSMETAPRGQQVLLLDDSTTEAIYSIGFRPPIKGEWQADASAYCDFTPTRWRPLPPVPGETAGHETPNTVDKAEGE